MRYLTVGTLWKNENDYALDFIHFHRKIGVEHFVIFNNADEADYSLEELLGKEKDIDIIRFNPKVKKMHQEAWGQLIEYNKSKTKWLALIDADQALVPVKSNSVAEILKDYEDFACLQLNWKAFGSSFQEKKLPGSVYERFLLTAEADSIYSYPTQFICQPSRTLSTPPEEPHYPNLPPGEISVNTNKEEISGTKVVAMNPSKPKIFNVPPLHDVMWVAHYTNKSKEEWIVKNNRGRADIVGEKIPTSQFDEYESQCNQVEELRPLELWNNNLFLIEEFKNKAIELGCANAAWCDGGFSNEGLKDANQKFEEIYKRIKDTLGSK